MICRPGDGDALQEIEEDFAKILNNIDETRVENKKQKFGERQSGKTPTVLGPGKSSADSSGNPNPSDNSR
jgi:hypothetical protein